MPIRPDLLPLYPGGGIRSPEWRAIRRAILERAGDRCEGTPQYPECRAPNGQPHPETGSIVILTIAHMDHDPANGADENLRALCQRCHLAHDRIQHLQSRRLRRDGQPDLFPEAKHHG